MGNNITYDKLLKISQEYSGLHCYSDGNKRFAHRVLERMFFRGKYGSLVSICMCADKGCVTLPEDIEHVEKIKVNGNIRSVFSHWYEFSNATEQDYYYGDSKHNSCSIQHLPNRFYTQYDPPCDSFYLVAKPRGHKEESSAYIKVHCRDVHGEKVFLRHNYNTESGEFLPLFNNAVTEGDIKVAQILGIEKSRTKDYVDLYAKDTNTGGLYFLSSYNPRETSPAYTRIRVGGCPDGQKVRLDILARLKLLPEYECTEQIPVIGLDVLETICQEIRLMKDNEFQASIAAGGVAKELIRDENNYKYGNNEDIMNIRDFDGNDSGTVF